MNLDLFNAQGLTHVQIYSLFSILSSSVYPTDQATIYSCNVFHLELSQFSA